MNKYNLFTFLIIAGLGWFIQMICDCIKECSKNKHKKDEETGG